MEDFWKKVRKGEYDEEKIRKAFEFAQKAHKGQKRIGGDNFFSHPLNVARLLLNPIYEMPKDSAMIAAALLHDTIEDTEISFEDIEKEFDAEIFNMVKGMTKVDHSDGRTNRPATHEKLLKEGSKDKRVFYIKLADILHNLHTIHALPEIQRKRIAREALAFHIPISKKMKLVRFEREIERMANSYLK